VDEVRKEEAFSATVVGEQPRSRPVRTRIDPYPWVPRAERGGAGARWTFGGDGLVRRGAPGTPLERTPYVACVHSTGDFEFSFP
jgi:hypothetical protein